MRVVEVTAGAMAAVALVGSGKVKRDQGWTAPFDLGGAEGPKR